MSVKYKKAIAMRTATVKRAPQVSGEVRIIFKEIDGRLPKPISLNSNQPIDLLKRTDVTLSDVKRSNLQDLVNRGAVEMIL